MKTIKQIITMVLVLTITLSSVEINAQKIPSETDVYNSSMRFLVDNSKSFYTKGMSKNEFILETVGDVTLTREAADLMNVIYNYHSVGSRYDGNTLKNLVNSGKSVDEAFKSANSTKKAPWWLRLLGVIIDWLIENL